MTDEQFTELVNLYLDKEISADDLKLLKDELARSPARKRAFSERCKLHQAMRLALDPKQKSRRSRSGTRSDSRSRSGSRSRQSSGRPDTQIRQVDEYVASKGVSQFPRWALGSGLAASILIAFILLAPVFRDSAGPPSSRPSLTAMIDGEPVSSDPLDQIGNSDLRRFSNARERREMSQHTSLVAQMRLLGLRPELTPEEKQLQRVNLASVERPGESISQAELFQRIQKLRAIPEQELLKIEEVSAASARWPSGFGTSLVNFEN